MNKENESKVHHGPQYVIHLRRDPDGSKVYDLGLQANGRLIRFSLPKPLCLEPSRPRYAIPEQPLPLYMADFEGNYLEDEKKLATLLVWDKGIYIPFESKKERLEDYFKRVFKEGKFTLYFESRHNRFKGNFSFVNPGGWDKEDWLIVKKKDKDSRTISRPFPLTSVISKLTLDQLEKRPVVPVTFPRINNTFSKSSQLPLF